MATTEIEKTEDRTKLHEGLEGHLSELRTRIFFCIAFFVASLALSFFFTPQTIQALQALAPKGSSFFQIKPGELFFVYIRLAVLVSCLTSVPFFLLQLKMFIWPGLKPPEKQIGNLLIYAAPALFIAGICFAYFIALKPMLSFLLGFGVDLALVQPQYSLDYYVSLVVAVMCVLGLAFQIPVLLFVMALMDLVSSAFLLKFWRHSLFASFVLAAVLTPTPDPINMGIVGIAIAGLYGFSLLGIKLIGK